MALYRTKQVIVEADQWFPPGHPEHREIEGVVTVADLPESVNNPDYGVRPGLHYVDDTNGQRVVLRGGDWVIHCKEPRRYLVMSAPEFDQAFDEADDLVYEPDFDTGDLPWWEDDDG